MILKRNIKYRREKKRRVIVLEQFKETDLRGTGNELVSRFAVSINHKNYQRWL